MQAWIEPEPNIVLKKNHTPPCYLLRNLRLIMKSNVASQIPAYSLYQPSYGSFLHFLYTKIKAISLYHTFWQILIWCNVSPFGRQILYANDSDYCRLNRVSFGWLQACLPLMGVGVRRGLVNNSQYVVAWAIRWL